MSRVLRKETIEKLRNMPIQDLLGKNFKQAGNLLTAHCPFHNPDDVKEKSPSFYIYPDNGYHCFSCGAHGRGAISFIVDRDNVDFKKAIEILDPSIKYNLEERQQSPKEYLKSKGIDDPATIEKYNLQITEHEGYPAIKFKIPTGFKYRRFGVKPKYKHAFKATRCIFKSDENHGKVGYINEGEIDSIVLNKYAGIPAWSASTGGNSKTVFEENLKDFENFEKIYLLYHTDKTGKDGTRDVARILGVERCDVVECPTKDWSDYFTAEYKKSDFEILLKNSKPAKDVLEIHKDADENEVEAYLLIDNQEFLKMDFPKNPWLVQGVIRLKGVALVAGDGGTGKSIFVLFLIKSITEGSLWLDRFEVPVPRKVLLIDKENDRGNIQTNLRSMGINSPNLYHALFPPIFQFTEHDQEEGEVLTEAAKRLSDFVIKNSIEVVILDSFVDFFQGNENDPVDVAKFSAVCKEVFPECCVILIHHESKPAQNGLKRNPGHRMRGSTHIFNMLSSALSLTVNDLEKPEIIYVEHSKVRGGRKQKPFEIEMIIEQDPENEKETVIRGFKYLGEAQPIRKKVDEAKEEIVAIARSHPNDWYSTTQYKNFLKGGGIGNNNISNALKELSLSKDLKVKTGERNANLYKFSGNSEDFDKNKAEEFLSKLEEDGKNLN